MHFSTSVASAATHSMVVVLFLLIHCLLLLPLFVGILCKVRSTFNLVPQTGYTIYVQFTKHNWASTRENLSSGVCEQQRSAQSDYSSLVICLLKLIIPKLATSDISLFPLVFVAKQAGLGMTMSESPMTCYLAS